MKFRKKTTATLLIAIFILSTLAIAIPVSALDDTWHVDDSVTESGDGTTLLTAFKTITEGIVAADPTGGDTIIVAAGTYTEAITIGKSLTLEGAQAGVDPTAPGARTDVTEESVIDGDSMLGPGVRITATGVTFQGFTVTGFTCNPYAPPEFPSGAGMGAIWATGDGVVIDGNIINNIRSNAAPPFLLTLHPTWWPAGIGIDVAASDAEVTNNLVHDVDSIGIRVRSDYEEAAGDTLMSDILVENNIVYETANTGVVVAGRVTDVMIKGNEIYDSLLPNPYSLWILAAYGYAPSYVAVEGNTISGGHANVWLLGVTDITISGNTISGAILYDSDPEKPGKNIRIQTGCSDIEINDNDILNADGFGVWSESAETPTVNYNNILGNTMGVENTVEVFLDAQFNFWGVEVDPMDIDDQVSAYVLYDPWLSDVFGVGVPVSLGDLVLTGVARYPIVSISLIVTDSENGIDFGEIIMGVVHESTVSLTIENTGEIKSNIAAQIIESDNDFYSRFMKIDGASFDTATGEWSVIENFVASTTLKPLPLILEVPLTAVDPGTYGGTLFFIAEAVCEIPTS